MENFLKLTQKSWNAYADLYNIFGMKKTVGHQAQMLVIFDKITLDNSLK